MTAASSYSTDVYKQFPIEIAFLATLVKNLWTFGLGYFINDLLLQKGPLLCIGKFALASQAWRERLTCISAVMISIPIYFVIVFTTAFVSSMCSAQSLADFSCASSGSASLSGGSAAGCPS